MKKSFRSLLLIVGIIIALVILYLIWIAVFDTKWLDLKRKTYENARYNFSLKYPGNWTLGEAGTNNAGRELYSSDKEVSCYAYGFTNALMNDKDEPQTLDEFVDWLTDYGSQEVLQRNNTILAGKQAIKLLIKEETTYKEAIYSLGKETGIGFYCIYPDMETIEEYAENLRNNNGSI